MQCKHDYNALRGWVAKLNPSCMKNYKQTSWIWPMTAFWQVQIPGFAGGGFVALAGRGYAVAGCAPGIAHPVGQHTFFGAAHTPVGNTNTDTTNKCPCKWTWEVSVFYFAGRHIIQYANILQVILANFQCRCVQVLWNIRDLQWN